MGPFEGRHHGVGVSRSLANLADLFQPAQVRPCSVASHSAGSLGFSPLEGCLTHCLVRIGRLPGFQEVEAGLL